MTTDSTPDTTVDFSDPDQAEPFDRIQISGIYFGLYETSRDDVEGHLWIAVASGSDALTSARRSYAGLLWSSGNTDQPEGSEREEQSRRTIETLEREIARLEPALLPRVEQILEAIRLLAVNTIDGTTTEEEWERCFMLLRRLKARPA